MWVFFNRDYGENFRGDLVDISDKGYIKNVLLEKKIVQLIDDPHKTYENIKKKEIDASSKIKLTKKE